MLRTELDIRETIHKGMEVFYNSFTGQSYCASLIMSNPNGCKDCKVRRLYPELVDYCTQKTLPDKYAKT